MHRLLHPRARPPRAHRDRGPCAGARREGGPAPGRRHPARQDLHDKAGTWKAVVDAGTDQILGVALLGHNAGEVLSAVRMAMLGRLPYQQVRDVVITHPTMGKGLSLFFDTLADDTAHG
ncbi:hypothetical protein [Streptomyces sp. GD-15H]|uniref:hypothetical protein n=1 Tax=Streptomyces sp. GD-15H TaxID=3129112 RepID=UPI0038735E77